jgi:o-succinylbenzoate synthase
MKIKSISTKIFKSKLTTPFKTALRRVDNLEDIIVSIQCEDGSVGYGEGAPTPVITGETIGTMNEAISYLTPMIVGLSLVEDFDEIIKIIHSRLLHNTTAKSALEIALYDLKSQSYNKPLFEYLGGTQTKFETDITISLNEPDIMIKDCLIAISAGYNIVKIKLGENKQKDIDRVLAIYDALPRNVKLRLDANQGWSKDDSVEIMQTIEKHGIIAECIEQPIKSDDINGLLYIKERIMTPLLADEAVFSFNDAKRILELGAADCLNIKLAKCGGISNAIKIADLAIEYNVNCMIGCMLEGPIGIAAALHFASAKSNIISMIDLDAVALLKFQPLKTDIEFNGKNILLSKEAGIGISGEL